MRHTGWGVQVSLTRSPAAGNLHGRTVLRRLVGALRGEDGRILTGVVLADAQALFREGLAALLERAGFNVIGQADTGQRALELVDRLRPDLVVLDATFPDMLGSDVCRAIVTEYPAVAVVALASDARPERVMLMAEAGARGYLLKDSDFETLRRAFEDVIGGGNVMHPTAMASLLRGLASRSESAARRLTARETQILTLAGEGLTNRQIAATVHLSPHTVKEYVSKAMHKLGAETRVEAVLVAERLGLLVGDAGPGSGTADPRSRS